MLPMAVEYALSAMAELTTDVTPRHAIAERTRIPRAYLAIVLKTLSRAGLIDLQRGVGGGVKLARPARKFTLLQIIDAVDPLTRKTSGTGPLDRKVDAIFVQM